MKFSDLEFSLALVKALGGPEPRDETAEQLLLP